MHTPKGNPQLKLQTYGSEICLLQGQQLTRSLTSVQTLRYLGVPIREKSLHVWGTTDQLSPALPSPTPPSPKDHHLASFHRVREAIAAKFISFPLERWQKQPC